ncbi:Predicted amidohydrolase [Paracoccus thiocyanatus]|uniref:Predicted amidohydrolase n=1 Tax=Paracoccus thiocyanatus TaxID=34006 RepID=A0A1N6V6L2_9RHOB|nr:carbon-nitrogen hydrolase family protein [Paracoccus thiocyanatus]SIQ73511.1 Predicted amidohydrolase [Paracoccus thiocyanatus]
MARGFKLAVAQTPGDLATTRDRIEWLAMTLSQLQGRDVDLLLLPELYLTGYNIGADVVDRAEASDGPGAARIADLARRFGIAVHYGYAERADGVIYGAAQCFGPDGTCLGRHRKLILPPGFESEYFAPGEGCSLFSWRGLRIATLICYDAEFPETARHVAALGAQLILVPTALGAQWGWVGRTMIPTRGYENGVFLAYANHAGQENGMAFLGESFIAAPDGQELARAGVAPEVLIADIDPTRVTQAQKRLPYLKDRLALPLSGDNAPERGGVLAT